MMAWNGSEMSVGEQCHAFGLDVRWMIRRTFLLFPTFFLVVRHQLALLSVYQSMHGARSFALCL